MICPHCHAPLKENATFCPHCGSDKNTGFKEGALFSDIEEIDYEEILENGFGTPPKKRGNIFVAIVFFFTVLGLISAKFIF